MPIQLIDNAVNISGHNLIGFNTKEYVLHEYKGKVLELYQNQIETFEAITSTLNHYILLIEARGGGKTWSVALSVHYLCSKIPKLRVTAFGPRFTQGKRILAQILDIDNGAIDKGASSTTQLQFKNGSKITADSANEKANIEGEHPHIAIVDERHKCLSGNTRIICEDKKERTIKEIVDNKLKVKIATYNFEKQKNEFSDILNYFNQGEKEILEIEYEVNGKIKKLKCTEDHKIYTKNRGYIEAGSLTEDDEIILYSKICEHCGKEFIPERNHYKTCSRECKNKLISYTEHKTKDKSITKKCLKCNKEFKVKYKNRNKKYCSNKCRSKLKTFVCKYCDKKYRGYIEKKYCSNECRLKFIEERRNSKKKNKCLNCGKPTINKFCNHECYKLYLTKEKECPVCGYIYKDKQRYCSEKCRQLALNNKKESSSERMKLNNPVKIPGVKEKIGSSLRRRINNMTEQEKNKFLKNWVNAPKYRKGKITKPEKIIIDLDISGLKYTGNGDYWVKFGNGKNKNPDFIKNKHVVEVGDFEYWHTEDEKKEVIKNYNKLGYKCLYLSAKEVYDNPNIKHIIEGFLQS